MSKDIPEIDPFVDVRYIVFDPNPKLHTVQ